MKNVVVRITGIAPVSTPWRGAILLLDETRMVDDVGIEPTLTACRAIVQTTTLDIQWSPLLESHRLLSVYSGGHYCYAKRGWCKMRDSDPR